MRKAPSEKPELTMEHFKFLKKVSEMKDLPAAMFEYKKELMLELVEHGFIKVVNDGKTYEITRAGKKALKAREYRHLLPKEEKEEDRPELLDIMNAFPEIDTRMDFAEITGIHETLVQAVWDKITMAKNGEVFHSSQFTFCCLGFENEYHLSIYEGSNAAPYEDDNFAEIVFERKRGKITVLQSLMDLDGRRRRKLTATEAIIYLRALINSDEVVLEAVKATRKKLK